MGKGGGKEVGLAVLQLERDWRFAFDCVHHLGRAQRDEDIVVAVPVHQGVGVRGDVDVEDADVLVLKDQVVVRLGSDFDFGSGLGGEDGGEG